MRQAMITGVGITDFGRFPVDRGQKRVPQPPARITAWRAMGGSLPTAALCTERRALSQNGGVTSPRLGARCQVPGAASRSPTPAGG